MFPAMCTYGYLTVGNDRISPLSLTEVDDLEWWHYFLLGSGTLIAILAVVAIGLIVVSSFNYSTI